jgi:hypothetical protein
LVVRWCTSQLRAGGSMRLGHPVVGQTRQAMTQPYVLEVSYFFLHSAGSRSTVFHMRTYTATISQTRFSGFRRQLLRNGGAIVMSVFCEGGYRVTYTAQAA